MSVEDFTAIFVEIFRSGSKWLTDTLSHEAKKCFPCDAIQSVNVNEFK